ncbi:unnamed protein product, partial [Agarophyton chilense]
MCGIVGCDCYLNGGVSSHNFHLPIPRIPQPPAVVQPPNQPSMSAPMSAAAPPFYGPASMPYAFASPFSYTAAPPGAFHNMVQVNVMEQMYPHHHASPSGDAAVPVQNVNNGATNNNSSNNKNNNNNNKKKNNNKDNKNSSSTVNHNSNSGNAQSKGAAAAVLNAAGANSMQPAVVPVQSSANCSPPLNGYDMYASTHVNMGSQPPNNVVYGAFGAHGQVGADSAAMMPPSDASGTHAPAPQQLWAEMAHSSNAGIVNMYNQNNHHHHHHHHSTDSGGKPIKNDGGGGKTLSSATNQSNQSNGSNGANARTEVGVSNGTDRAATTTDRWHARHARSKRQNVRVQNGHGQNGRMGSTARVATTADTVHQTQRDMKGVQKDRMQVESARGTERQERQLLATIGLERGKSEEQTMTVREDGRKQSDGKTDRTKGSSSVKRARASRVREEEEEEEARKGVDMASANGLRIEGGESGESGKRQGEYEVKAADAHAHTLGMQVRAACGRAAAKRRRNNVVVESDSKGELDKHNWQGRYIAAGNTGVPAM